VSLWAALEAVAVPAAVGAEWRDLLGPDDALALPFLRATRRLAESYPRPGGGDPYAVVVHGPGDLVGCDPDGGDPVPLTEDDVRVWEFDRPRLLRAVAAALGVEPDPRPDPAWSRRAGVGTARSPLPRDYPCVYVEARRPDDWAVTAGQLLFEFPDPFVLLTPTRRWVSRMAEAQLRHQRSALVVLAEALAWDGPGRFRARVPLAAALAALESRGAPVVAPDRPVTPPYLFRRGTGRTWAVRFAGVAAEIDHVVGMTYLARLLAAPGVAVPALELQAAARVGPAGPTGPGDELVDDAARVAYRARLEELSEELEDARETGNAAAEERVLTEVAAIDEQLKAAASLRGPRRSATPAGRARPAVTNAIRLAIDVKITPAHPALGRHLDLFIDTGASPRYQPGEPIAWEL
jgi:hypothetical protein